MRIKMPAVRIAQADAEAGGGGGQDILTCGVCQKPFALGDIVKFIQHKVLSCNKENYSCLEQGGGNHLDSGDSDDGGQQPLGVVNTRRPSISAPMKKTSPRVLCTPSPEEPVCSTPIKDGSDQAIGADEDQESGIRPRRIKEELDSSADEAGLKKSRTEVADAESNTTHSEPSNYVCSTCKQRLHSAWRLVQHVQTSHGIKIYVESPGSSPKSGNSQNCSSSSSCSTSSPSSTTGPGNGNGGPTVTGGAPLPLPATRLLPSPLVDPLHAHHALHAAHHHAHPFAVGGLLRMPQHPGAPFPPTSVSSPLGNHLTGPHGSPQPTSLFARPSSHHDHFRMEQLVSEQFRHHGLGLAAAAAAVAAAGGPPPPHPSFPHPSPTDRPTPPIPPPVPTSRSSVPPPSPLSLPLEPQLDFYSQRLRQLAGTTSPGAVNGSSSPSPRKLSPPFTSPSNNPSSLPPPPPAIPSAPPPSNPSPLALNTPTTTSSNIPTTSSSSNSNTTSNLLTNNNNNSSVNNNNDISNTNNNNLSSPTDENQLHRPSLSVTPPEKNQRADSPTSNSIDLTSTPHSASTPPNSEKPADFSMNSSSANSANDKSIRACEYCGKKFRFQSNLVVHRRTHTGEKPYKCSVCNHACSQSSKLKRHMRIHRISSRTTSGEDGNGENISADQMSTGSVESLDDDCEDDEDEELEDEEEEEEEEEEEDMELEEEEEGDEDDDLGGDAPEDLTTKSTSSTPPNSGESNKMSSSTPRPTPTATPLEKVATSGSLVGELMDKFGLSNIQQYSEAYKQALQESVVGPHQLHISKKDDFLHRSPIISDNNNKPSTPTGRVPENGMSMKSAALRIREEFAKNIISGQPPLDLVAGHHGIFGHNPFENPFDTSSKRIKLELENHHGLGRVPGDRDSLYAGLWLPAMAHHRDQLFPGESPMDILSSRSKMNSENSFVKNGPKPGPSASLAAAAAAALNIGLPGQQMKKESRRNDTCEYCGKVFKNCSNLTVHRRSHTGEKPYKCELCSYACAQSSKLTRHMKTHGRLGKDVYRCRFCEMPFSVPSTLEKHMRKCVVNQNNKAGILLPSIMSGDEDSSASASKDTT